MIICDHPSDCPCWYRKPGQILGCNCSGDPADHTGPSGCRYTDADNWEAWRDWPGVSGKVIVCQVHGGRAPGEAYDDITTTVGCLDSTTSTARVPRKPRAKRETSRGRLELAVIAAEARGEATVTVGLRDLSSLLRGR